MPSQPRSRTDTRQMQLQGVQGEVQEHTRGATELERNGHRGSSASQLHTSAEEAIVTKDRTGADDSLESKHPRDHWLRSGLDKQLERQTCIEITCKSDNSRRQRPTEKTRSDTRWLAPAKVS